MDEKKFDEMSNDLKERFSKFVGRDITAESQISLAIEITHFLQFNDNFKNSSLKDASDSLANGMASYITSRPEFMKMSKKAKLVFLGQLMEKITGMFAISTMIDDSLD